ncbi:MAG TPA: hypothetical protein VMV47_15180 [Bacteroidales bacterium]|nr:hypothetical protein [Bacteroidales bacterium]
MKKVRISGPMNDLKTKVSTFFNTVKNLCAKLLEFYEIFIREWIFVDMAYRHNALPTIAEKRRLGARA